MMELFQLCNRKRDWDFIDDGIIIKTIEAPSMYPEFEPGPPEDHPFPEFWDVSVFVYHIKTDKSEIILLDAKGMQKLYPLIHGRRERIGYWRIMKYLQWEESND